VSIITQSNISAESGRSFPTNWALSPPPYPAVISKLKQNADEQWAQIGEGPYADFRKASTRAQFFLPREGQLDKSMCDQFLRFANGERFTMESIGYVADMFLQIPELYLEEERHENLDAVHDFYWYPTVVLNLDIKKVLPPEGVEILFVRVRSKEIKNGRSDLEVVILDEEGDIVALSHHVALMLSSDRNTAKRGGKKAARKTKL